MTLGSLSSLATTALDTARTTFKAMAEAAAPAAEADQKNTAGEQTAATAGRADAAVPSRRLGTVLDAYA